MRYVLLWLIFYSLNSYPETLSDEICRDVSDYTQVLRGTEKIEFVDIQHKVITKSLDADILELDGFKYVDPKTSRHRSRVSLVSNEVSSFARETFEHYGVVLSPEVGDWDLFAMALRAGSILRSSTCTELTEVKPQEVIAFMIYGVEFWPGNESVIEVSIDEESGFIAAISRHIDNEIGNYSGRFLFDQGESYIYFLTFGSSAEEVRAALRRVMFLNTRTSEGDNFSP